MGPGRFRTWARVFQIQAALPATSRFGLAGASVFSFEAGVRRSSKERMTIQNVMRFVDAVTSLMESIGAVI